MRKFLQKRKRKGFTLVELLIVIIIIGILAGSMLLVMGAGKDKAEATKIVSNLRSMKAAAMMCYADNNDWPTGISSLEPYMDGAIPSDYALDPVGGPSGGASGDVFWLTISGLSANSGVNEKLEAMAADVNLKGSASTASGDFFTKDKVAAWVIVNQ